MLLASLHEKNTEYNALYPKYKRPPVIWGLDSVHGANYLYNTITTPQAINLAATFNVSIPNKSILNHFIINLALTIITDHCIICRWKMGKCGHSTSWYTVVV